MGNLEQYQWPVYVLKGYKQAKNLKGCASHFLTNFQHFLKHMTRVLPATWAVPHLLYGEGVVSFSQTSYFRLSRRFMYESNASDLKICAKNCFGSRFPRKDEVLRWFAISYFSFVHPEEEQKNILWVGGQISRFENIRGYIRAFPEKIRGYFDIRQICSHPESSDLLLTANLKTQSRKAKNIIMRKRITSKPGQAKKYFPCFGK